MGTIERIRFWAVILLTVLTVGFYAKVSLRHFNDGEFRGDFAAIWQPLVNIRATGQPASSFNISVHTLYADPVFEAIAKNSEDLDSWSQFAIHTHFYLYPLSLFGEMVESPYFLLWVQALTFGGFVLLLGLRGARLGIGTLPLLLLLLAFATSPFSLGLIANDFHFDCFAGVAVGSFALLAFGRNPSLWSLLVWGLATVAIKDSFVALVFGAGLSLMLTKGQRLKGAVVALLGIASYFFVLKVAVPYFSGGRAFMFDGVYGSKLGGSMTQIAYTGLTHPQLLWEAVCTDLNGRYIGMLLLACPVLFLLRPRVLLLGAGFLFVNLVTSNPGMKFAWGQYSAVIVCVVNLAALEAYPGVSSWLAKKGGRWLQAVVLAAVLVAPLYFARSFSRVPLLQPPSARPLVEFAPLLGLEKSLVIGADDRMANFLANRKSLYIFPLKMERLDVVVLSHDVDVKPWYLSNDTWTQAREVLLRKFKILCKTPRYVVWCRSDLEDARFAQLLSEVKPSQ